VSTGLKVDTAKMKLAADQEANDGPASMDLSADGSTLLAINTKSGVIRLWSVNSQQIMRQITVARRDGRMFPTGNVRFLDNHTFGAWCPTSQAIFRGRTDTSEKDKWLPVGAPRDRGTLSANGEILAVMPSRGRCVILWDVEKDRQRQALRHDDNAIMAVAFSPNGQHVATGGLDNTVRLWQVADAARLVSIKGHGKGDVFLPVGVYSLAFSPCGRFLASGGHDGCVNVWDASSYERVHTFRVTFKPIITSITFSRDSRLLACGFIGAEKKAGLCVWEMSSNRHAGP
jgi:WD40 repeat protein